MNEQIRELAREAKGLKGKTNTEAGMSTPFSLVAAEYPDIVIERKTSRTTKTMGIIVSEGLYFIKTEAAKKEPVIEVLTEELYGSFTAGMPEFDLPEGFWTAKICPGISVGRKLLGFLRDELFVQMVREKTLPKESDILNDHYSFNGPITSLAQAAYRRSPVAYMEALDKPKSFNLVLNGLKMCVDILSAYGVIGLKKFYEQYETSLASFHECRGDYSDLDNILAYRGLIDIDRFISYSLYDSVHMGYGTSELRFFGYPQSVVEK